MIQVMYIGDTIIIEQSATHGIIHYLEEKIVREWSLEWNELLECYKDAIQNDTNGTYYDENFKELMES